MKYVNYNTATKQILGYYDDEIHELVPEPNFQISQEVWQKALNEGANFADVKKKKLYRVEPEIDEKALKTSELQNEINELKEEIRNALIIGNDKVIAELRQEYKDMLSELETLKGENK